jgi:hypothetical protein
MIARTVVAVVLGTMLGVVQTSALAASRDQIDAKVQEAVGNFYKQTGAGKQLAQKAAGMLPAE